MHNIFLIVIIMWLSKNPRLILNIFPTYHSLITKTCCSTSLISLLLPAFDCLHCLTLVSGSQPWLHIGIISRFLIKMCQRLGPAPSDCGWIGPRWGVNMDIFKLPDVLQFSQACIPTHLNHCLRHLPGPVLTSVHPFFNLIPEWSF